MEEGPKRTGRWTRRLLALLVLILVYGILWSLTAARGPEKVQAQLEARKAAAPPEDAPKGQRLDKDPRGVPYPERPEQYWYLGGAQSPCPFIVTVDEAAGGQVSATGTRHYALWLFGYTLPLWTSPRWEDRNVARLSRTKELDRFGVTVEELAAALRDPNKNVRAHAAWRLFYLGGGAAPAVPALLDRLRTDPEPEVRLRAAQALGSIGGEAAPAVPALVAVLKDPAQAGLHGQAIFALGGIGAAAGEAVPAIIEALKTGPQEVRLEAVQALGKIGVPAKVAIPILNEVRKTDPSEEIRSLATRAMNDLQSR
jgi:hypothetical protein